MTLRVLCKLSIQIRSNTDPYIFWCPTPFLHQYEASAVACGDIMADLTGSLCLPAGMSWALCHPISCRIYTHEAYMRSMPLTSAC